MATPLEYKHDRNWVTSCFAGNSSCCTHTNARACSRVRRHSHPPPLPPLAAGALADLARGADAGSGVPPRNPEGVWPPAARGDAGMTPLKTLT